MTLDTLSGSSHRSPQRVHTAEHRQRARDRERIMSYYGVIFTLYTIRIFVYDDENSKSFVPFRIFAWLLQRKGPEVFNTNVVH